MTVRLVPVRKTAGTRTCCIPELLALKGLIHIPAVEERGTFEKMKLNKPGRQKLVSYKPCKQGQHANICSYLLLAKQEGTFGSPGGPLISVSAVPHRGGFGYIRPKHKSSNHKSQSFHSSKHFTVFVWRGFWRR